MIGDYVNLLNLKLVIGLDRMYLKSEIEDGIIDSVEIWYSSIFETGPCANWWFGRYPVS